MKTSNENNNYLDWLQNICSLEIELFQYTGVIKKSMSKYLTKQTSKISYICKTQQVKLKHLIDTLMHGDMLNRYALFLNTLCIINIVELLAGYRLD